MYSQLSVSPTWPVTPALLGGMELVTLTVSVQQRGDPAVGPVRLPSGSVACLRRLVEMDLWGRTTHTFSPPG